MILRPYKRRRIDYQEPVEVYRNLNMRKGVWYSIRQFGQVVAHCDEVSLLNANFIVRAAGRENVIETGVKNVHAWVRGEFVKSGFVKPEKNIMHRVTYNPKTTEQFINLATNKPIHYATAVILKSDGVWVDESVNL